MSEGLAKRVAGTLVLGVIGLIVLPLLIDFTDPNKVDRTTKIPAAPVSYAHLRAHETKANLVCRLLLEKKKNQHHPI